VAYSDGCPVQNLHFPWQTWRLPYVKPKIKPTKLQSCERGAVYNALCTKKP